jgi:hypothetical protein
LSLSAANTAVDPAAPIASIAPNVNSLNDLNITPPSARDFPGCVEQLR